jgi:Amt family ammonium transporter
MNKLLTTAAMLTVSTAALAETPVANPGNTSWMLISTILVTLMAIPGLALFYGGLVRSKNMLSVLMQTFTVFALMAVLWVATH